MKLAASHVRRLGPYFVRGEQFGAVVYSPKADRFYALSEGAFRELQQQHDGQVELPPPGRRAGVPCRPVDLEELLLREGSDAGGPVMFGRPDVVPGHPPTTPMMMPAPAEPLLVNWLITTECCYDCVYCYASDLRRNGGHPVTKREVEKVAHQISSLPCLAVVLTGGEPLLSPHLRTAIAALRGKRGVILDTSGDGPLEDLLPTLVDADAHVRVSLDSPSQEQNNSLRPGARGQDRDAHAAALRAIQLCDGAGVRVSVQTVLSNKNSDRESLSKLLDLLTTRRVARWNLYLMVSAGSARGAEEFPNRDNAFKAARRVVRWSRALRTEGLVAPTVRIVDSSEPDSVVLISPEGVALTESPDGRGKIAVGDLLGGADPFIRVNRSYHAWRYFGWIPGSNKISCLELGASNAEGLAAGPRGVTEGAQESAGGAPLHGRRARRGTASRL